MTRSLTYVVLALFACLGLSGAAATPAEALAQIQKVGPTNPEWWDLVTKQPPATLKLDWSSSGGWNPRENLGAYVRDVRRQPNMWRPTIKLLHRVVELNKGNPKNHLQSVRELATAYCLLEGDHVRGAYWWLQAQRLTGGKGTVADVTNLADCYIHLGCIPEAKRELENVRRVATRTGAHVRLRAEWGRVSNNLIIVDRAFGCASDS